MHGSEIGVKCEATMSTSTTITTACHTDHALGPNFLVTSILFLDLNTLPRTLSAMLQDLSVQLLLCSMPFELDTFQNWQTTNGVVSTLNTNFCPLLSLLTDCWHSDAKRFFTHKFSTAGNLVVCTQQA
jgi:hypothetical protein